MSARIKNPKPSPELLQRVAGSLDLYIARVPLGELHSATWNARTHTKKQVEQIAVSIAKFGFNNPVLVDDDNRLIAGHGRVAAAKLLGMAEVPTIRLSHLSEAERRAYALAENRLAELAGWDEELLTVELLELKDLDLDFDVEITGFDLIDIDRMEERVNRAKAAPEDDRVPEPEAQAVSKVGDLWLLGEHRLVCGDARDATVYERLMDGQPAQMVFSDPPYNVKVDHNVCGLGRIRHREFVMASGEMSKDAFTTFLRDAFRQMAAASQDGAVHFNRAIRRHRSTAASPSLLAGLIRDGEGVPLTPTHAVKKGRRYRYYVSHDLIVRRIGSKDDQADEGVEISSGTMDGVRRSSARRIPASDVEAAVEGRIVAFLGAAAEVDDILGPHARDIDERRQLHRKAEALASGWERQPALDRAKLIRNLLAAVVVEEETIRISVGLDRLLLLLRDGPVALEAACADLDPISPSASRSMLDLTVAAKLKRVGMEMKLLINEPGAQHQRKPDRSLVRLLAQARRYRDLLMARGNRTITELAEVEGVIPSYFTRILRLVWLAPDITDAILDGRQPIELSAKRLSAMSNLPPDWPAQRAALGFTPRG